MLFLKEKKKVKLTLWFLLDISKKSNYVSCTSLSLSSNLLHHGVVTPKLTSYHVRNPMMLLAQGTVSTRSIYLRILECLVVFRQLTSGIDRSIFITSSLSCTTTSWQTTQALVSFIALKSRTWTHLALSQLHFPEYKFLSSEASIPWLQC